MGGVVGEVDGAAEHIQHAAVDVAAAQDAEVVVHRLGVRTAQVLELVNADIPQVPRDTGPDTGSRLEVGSFSADGVILATPTGSTAYNLSAGGPLLDANVPAMVLTPICPHTLTQRPLVLPDSLTVAIQLGSSDEVRLALDGAVGPVLEPGAEVRVSRSAHPVRFVTPTGRDHFETLRTKLGWGAT